MSTLISTPAERITEALKESGHTAAEICKLTGISKPSLSCWMSGKYAPKGDALYKLGRALNVSEMWLAGYDVPRERLADRADVLADVITRARKDEAFRALLDLIVDLTPAQVITLSQVADLFPKADRAPSAAAPDREPGPAAP